MKTEKNILIAFVLNLSFSFFEFIGGIFTGSVAIISDSIHDIGDAASIGISYFLEKKSKKAPDEHYTYGYIGYSVIGGLITTIILLFGSFAVILNAIEKIISPTAINYNGMIVFAIIGVIINLLAAIFTHKGDSINQKAVNLHMLEDVLGWIVVLIGAIVMNFTHLYIIDPLMSIGVAVFIIINSLKNLNEIFDILLHKSPKGINVNNLKKHLCKINGVLSVHHIHVWSIDGFNNYATMHIVANGEFSKIKNDIRKELKEHGISHVTLEFENENEACEEKNCIITVESSHRHNHNHNHNHK